MKLSTISFTELCDLIANDPKQPEHNGEFYVHHITTPDGPTIAVQGYGEQILIIQP